MARTRLMRVRISERYCLLYSRLRAFTRIGLVAAFGIMTTEAERCWGCALRNADVGAKQALPLTRQASSRATNRKADTII